MRVWNEPKLIMVEFRRGLPWACKELLYTLGSGQLVDSSQSVTYLSTKLLHESDADALKHAGLLRFYKILLLYLCCALLVWIIGCTYIKYIKIFPREIF